MQAELPISFQERLIGVLQDCRQKKNLLYATHLHAYMRQQRLDLHPVLGNFLIPMLVECGNVADAQNAFDRFAYPNEYSWTSLMSGYISSGDPQHALDLYRKMSEAQDCVQPNRITYLALLDACTRLKDAERGKALHTEIIQRGLDGEVFNGSALLGNTLVSMYGKCWMLAEAWHVFEGLPVQDAISWTSLITGYSEQGLCDEALKCFNRMCMEGVSANAVTLVPCLRACGNLITGRYMHSEIVKRGLEQELYVSSALVERYGKYGSLVEAHRLLNRLAVRDAICWTALLTGYAEHGHYDKVLDCFEHMQEEGVPTDAFTIGLCVKACSTLGALEKGQRLYSELVKMGSERDICVGTVLVDMYGHCGFLAEAQWIFDRILVRNDILWTALISGYAHNGFNEEALKFFKKMQLEGVPADAATFIVALKACGTSGAFESHRERYTEACTGRDEMELYVDNALVDMYSRCGSTAEAGALETGREIHAQIVNKGLEKELYVGNTLVDMYCRNGVVTEACAVLHMLPSPDTVSWNALIAGYIEYGLSEKALDCLKQMLLEGVSPDVVSLVLCLKACSSIGALAMGLEVHTEVAKVGLENDFTLGNVLIDMYGECGSVFEGEYVFDRLPVRDVGSWNAMIKAYGENHESNMAVQCFEDMQVQGVKPDSITFTCLLGSCSHASLVLKGQEYFNLMREHKIEPLTEHYVCMVDLFARSGHIYEAERFILAMECPPPTTISMAMLTASKCYGEVALGRRCFQQLVALNPDNAAAYLLLADMNASACKWADAKRVENMRKHIGANKRLASAKMEANKNLHEFVVGKREIVLEALENLTLFVKNKGYVPNLDLILEYSWSAREVECF